MGDERLSSLVGAGHGFLFHVSSGWEGGCFTSRCVTCSSVVRSAAGSWASLKESAAKFHTHLWNLPKFQSDALLVKRDSWMDATSLSAGSLFALDRDVKGVRTQELTVFSGGVLRSGHERGVLILL